MSENLAFYKKYAMADIDSDGVNELILCFELWEKQYGYGELSTGTHNGYYYSFYKYTSNGLECVDSFRSFGRFEDFEIVFYSNGTYSYRDSENDYHNINENIICNKWKRN